MLELNLKLTSSNEIWEFCNDIKYHGISATIHAGDKKVDALDIIGSFNFIEHKVAILQIHSHRSSDIKAFISKWRYCTNEASGN